MPIIHLHSRKEGLSMKRYMQLASLALCLAPTAALAHTGIGNTSGFMHGFMHPLSGLDHQLAMVLVGLFAYQLGGRALWLIPLTFVSLMAVGGFLGATTVPIASVDVCIALSVIVLGIFAIFHGHAHGSEMPLDAAGVECGTGFMMATAVLHAVGIGIGFLIGMAGTTYDKTIGRAVGGFASIAGLPCSS